MSTDPALNEYVSGSNAGGGIGNTFNLHLYNYGNNNPISYKDPDGRSPTSHQFHMAFPGESCGGGLLPEWHVSGRGSGVGLFAATVPLTSNGAEIDSSWYDMTFTIEETKESFSTKFQSLNTSGVGVKLGAGVYVVDVQAKGVFKGVKPTQSQIIETFGGKSEVVGFSFLWFGVTGSENENWITNTGTLGVSWGSPISVGVEKSFTRERK